MKLAQLSTLVAVASMLAMPAFAADTAGKPAATKPEAKTSTPAKTCAKKCANKVSKVKKASKAAK